VTETVAIVTTVRRDGRDSVDSEKRVGSLAELYEACRQAPPSALVRVTLRGDHGEVHLDFGTFIRDGAGDPA
jgi:hypothetical protein